MSEKLNLGCGEFKKPGYINVDCYSVSEPDVRHNLEEFPYPFDDHQFSLIEADHLLEHLEDAFQVMKELWRISGHGGLIKIKVPHFSRGFTHAQHKRGFDASFPLYFNPTYQGGYQGIPLELVSMKLKWFAQPSLRKTILTTPQYVLGKMLGKLIDMFANLSPFLCSRLWCFWVGGFEEIEFQFKVSKQRDAEALAPAPTQRRLVPATGVLNLGNLGGAERSALAIDALEPHISRNVLSAILAVVHIEGQVHRLAFDPFTLHGLYLLVSRPPPTCHR